MGVWNEFGIVVLCVDDINCAKALIRVAGNKAVNVRDDNGMLWSCFDVRAHTHTKHTPNTQ